jgi:hypothetical protein
MISFGHLERQTLEMTCVAAPKLAAAPLTFAASCQSWNRRPCFAARRRAALTSGGSS